MYLIKVWEHDSMIFEGKSKTIPKIGEGHKNWYIKKDNNGIVTEAVYNPVKYRVTYEDTKI
jgi:hypothetical protein